MSEDKKPWTGEDLNRWRAEDKADNELKSELPFCTLSLAQFASTAKFVSVSANGSIEQITEMFRLALLESPTLRTGILLACIKCYRDIGLDIRAMMAQIERLNP